LPDVLSLLIFPSYYFELHGSIFFSPRDMLTFQQVGLASSYFFSTWFDSNTLSFPLLCVFSSHVFDTTPVLYLFFSEGNSPPRVIEDDRCYLFFPPLTPHHPDSTALIRQDVHPSLSLSPRPPCASLVPVDPVHSSRDSLHFFD